MIYSATTYTWNPQPVVTDDLTLAIYAQLLELYLWDVEVELMAEKLKNSQLPAPISPFQWPRPNDPYWPQINPIWYGPPYIVTC